MRLRLQFAGCLLALGISGAVALPSAAQRPRVHSVAHPQQRPAARQQAKQQRQAERQQEKVQKPKGEARNETAPQGGTNPNRPPAANNRQADGNAGGNRPRNLTPEDKQKLAQTQRKFNQLPPQQQQEMRERAQVWQHMTPEQRQHIKNDVLPKWKQMPQDRRQTIQRKLQQLKNMPESARNQRLNDPEFTRGMSEEDKGTLKDLSHLHVGGAPDPPTE
jgi:hypothetical protein